MFSASSSLKSESPDSSLLSLLDDEPSELDDELELELLWGASLEDDSQEELLPLPLPLLLPELLCELRLPDEEPDDSDEFDEDSELDPENRSAKRANSNAASSSACWSRDTTCVAWTALCSSSATQTTASASRMVPVPVPL